MPEIPKLPIQTGDPVICKHCDLAEKITQPPLPLKEYELIDLMDQKGIGTDATISQHIQTICDRKYVVVVGENGIPLPAESRGFGAGGRGRKGSDGGDQGAKGVVLRHLHPTPLGLALISCFDEVCPRLAQPSLRASMERELTLIATGATDKETVLDGNLASFLREYTGFVSEIARIRSHFVDDAAIDGIIEATQAQADQQRLATLSDFAIRRQDEELSVVSDVIADAERRRLITDREAVSKSLQTSAMSEEDQIKSLFSYSAPTSDRSVLEGGPFPAHHFYSGSNSGVPHYTAELQRLRALPERGAEVSAPRLPAQTQKRGQRDGRGLGRGVRGRGGRGGHRGGREAGGSGRHVKGGKATALPRKPRESRESRKGVFVKTKGEK